MMTMLAHAFQLVHTIRACESTQAGFDSPNVPRRMNRRPAVFFRPYAFVRLLWAGDGGEGASPAGSLGRRSVNPAICPPTPFDSGERVNPSKEASTMANLALRTSAHNQFPFTSDEARHAARLWFVPAQPSMTLAEWRDHFLHRHLTGIRCDNWRERLERTDAWNEAFSASVAAHIAEVSRHG